MNYHVDTIPIWDALKLNKGCLFCALREKTEDTLVKRYLGASVMEPSTRIRVNDKGFCQKHQNMLFKQENKLGHALLMQSHMAEINKKLENAFDEAISAQKKSIFFKADKKSGDCFALFLNSCIICEDLKDNMERYCYSFLYLYKTDSRFKNEFLASKGLCLPDVQLVMDMAAKRYNDKLFRQLASDIKQQTLAQLSEIKGDIDWFTQKFDYRNQNAPWKNSKDALQRCINFLSGKTIGGKFWENEK